MICYLISKEEYFRTLTYVVRITNFNLYHNNRYLLSAIIDPRKAVELALSAKEEWSKELDTNEILISYKNGEEEIVFDSDNDAIRWGEERYNKLDKCFICKNILIDEYFIYGFLEGEKFCSTECATLRYNSIYGV